MAIGHPARTGKGYVQVWRAGGGGDLEHRAIVARVLGRPVPRGVEIHHVDGNPRNNDHGNLVVCQDKAYHKLLHVRQRVVRAGGDPNTQRICSRCKRVLAVSRFSRRRSSQSGYQTACKPCGNEYRRHKNIPEPNEEWRAA